MSRADQNYHKLRVLGRKLYHHGNKGGQKRILIALHCHNNEMTTKELIEHFEIKAGSLSEILSKMEEDDLIVRHRINDKTKCQVIKVSEKGQAKINEYIRQRDEVIAKLFKDFSEEDHKNFESILDRCLKNFDEELL